MPKRTDDELSAIKTDIDTALSDSKRQQETAEVAQLINRFIKGDQWYDLDPKTKRITTIERPMKKSKQRERVVVNFIYPIWKTYKSLIMQDMPRVSAIPEDPKDIMDTYAIDFAEKIVHYLIETTLSNEELLRILNTLFSYGGVYLYPTVTKIDGAAKAVNEIIPPNQIFPWPLGVTNLKDALGFAWARMVPVDILEVYHPNEKISGGERPAYLSDDENAKPNRDQAFVVDWYRKPAGKYLGCYSRSINGNITLDFDGAKGFLTSYPFKHNEIPYIYIPENDLQPDPFGFPSLELILGAQVAYNMAESLLAELRKFLPKLLVPKETKIEVKDTYSKLDDVLEYFSGFGNPAFIGPPQGSMALYQSGGIAQQAEHTVGLHGVFLRGESIGSVQSGVGIQSLQKQDEQRSSPLKMNLLIGQQKYFRQAYSNIDQFYTKNQVKAILGDKAELHYRVFKTIKLSPMTFKIDVDYLYPKNPMVERQTAVQIAQYGGIDMKNQTERRAWLKIVAPELAAQLNPDVIEENRARMENKILFEKDVVPDELDNDDIHIQIINEIIRDPRFNDLGNQIKARFMAHRKVHMKRAEDKFKKVMEAQRQAQTKLPEQPAPGGPEIPQGGSGG